MKDILKQRRWIGMAAGVFATVAVLGCSGDDSGLDRRYKVSGTVTYKNAPVETGTVVFEPTNPPPPAGRVAQGTIEKGSYSLTTATAGDGALAGEYKVIILSSDLNVAELAKKQGGMLHQGDAEHTKAIKAIKNPLPAKYAQSANTPLKATVKSGSNTFDFPLED